MIIILLLLPKNWNFLIQIFEKLSKDFIYMNLVFYILNDKIIKIDEIIVSNSNELLFNRLLKLIKIIHNSIIILFCLLYYL